MRRYVTSLVLSLLLLLLFLFLPTSGQAERQILQAVPNRWKKHSRLIIAIARHESAGYSSNVFKKCNNPFGLKTFKQTNCPAPASENPPGVKLYYASFDSLSDATNALIRWLERRNISPVLSSEDVLREMIRYGYATDKKYFDKIKRML